MSADTRSSVIKRLASRFALGQKAHVDMILRTAGADTATPPGWERQNERQQRDTLIILLSRLPPAAYERLRMAFADEPSAIGAVGDYLSEMSEAEADMMLRSYSSGAAARLKL